MSDYARTQPICLDEQQAVDADCMRIWLRHAPDDWEPRDCGVSYFHQGPFTVCLLRHAAEHSLDTYVGVTKQCRYADRADEYDPQRGERIALSRALQNAKRSVSDLQWLENLSKESPV